MFLLTRPLRLTWLIATITFLGLAGHRALFYSSTTGLPLLTSAAEENPKEEDGGTLDLLPVPPEYAGLFGGHDGHGQTQMCADNFGTSYLGKLRDRATEHCSSKSEGILTCFHGPETGLSLEPMCIMRNVVLREETGNFTLDCDVTHDGREPSRMLEQFHVNIDRTPGARHPVPLRHDEHWPRQTNYTILVQREANASFWDSLMEVFSMMLSIDVLRMSRDTRLGKEPFYAAPADMPRTQVIILDDLPKGPVYDLWSFFAGSAPIRLSKVLANTSEYASLSSAHTAIVPFPGRTNPLSRIGDHGGLDCHSSALVRTFAGRALQYYGLWRTRGWHDVSDIAKVTIINPVGAGRIKDMHLLLEGIRSAFPLGQVVADEVDFAAIPMAWQLQIVRATDILVGVHGAGLSHVLFMREGEGAVIEIQPSVQGATPRSERYKKLAGLMGQEYFSMEAEILSAGQLDHSHKEHHDHAAQLELLRRGESDETEIVVSQAKLVSLVGRAIEALIAGAGSTGRSQPWSAHRFTGLGSRLDNS